MKPGRCHQPLLDGIQTLINSHVWKSTAHHKVIAQLPTPVTCHSIGTPLAGTQILTKYSGGMPTSRPPRIRWMCNVNCIMLMIPCIFIWA
jgi:hypothetical protein